MNSRIFVLKNQRLSRKSTKVDEKLWALVEALRHSHLVFALRVLPEDLWLTNPSNGMSAIILSRTGQTRPLPLIPIAWARENKVVFDFDTGRFIFKGIPTQVYSAKAGLQANGQFGKKSYWLIPLTAKAFAQTQVEKFDSLPETQKQPFRSAVDSDSFTQEELTSSNGDSSSEPSPEEALGFSYSCEYSNVEE